MGKLTICYAGGLVGLLLFGFAGPACAQQEAPLLIFFDSGKPVLTRDATETLAAVFRSAPLSAQWYVTGHADRSGTGVANRNLARARARATRDYLVLLGAADTKITLVDRGEDEPLVATADGVWEAQNRRVEIRLAP
jgi:OOP family OmpA-OmpF porin